ncbi:MAG: hypothetical protein SX243_03050 [Acidobacteriota bacterium]|nr:hypothetical protein [Acidobacteriota bacterium]
MKRFFPALAVFLFNLLTAPFLGQVRDTLLDAFGEGFVRWLSALLALVLVLVVGVGLWRIRDRRKLRYGLLALVVGLIALETLVAGSGIPRVDVVEKVHFVQYGLLAAALHWALLPRRDLSGPLLAMLGITAAGTLEEWVHWWSPQRVGEMGDVGLNVYAGFCGLLAATAFLPPETFRWRLPPRRRAQVARWAVPVVVLLAGFYHAAHVGYEIVDPEVGRFLSWHSEAELAEAVEERRLRWAVEEPGGDPWEREDRYRTEGGWHVSHRNASMAAGKARVAWVENRILEKYFDPFLDQRPSRGEGTHRWSEEQRAEVAEAAGNTGPAPGYVSPVLRGRVRPRPTAGTLWALAGTLALALAFFGWREFLREEKLTTG